MTKELTAEEREQELSRIVRLIVEQAQESPDAPPSKETLFRLFQARAAQLEALLPITTLIRTNADLAKTIWEHNALFAALCTRAKYRAGLVWAELAELADANDPGQEHWEPVYCALRAENAQDCLGQDELAKNTRKKLADCLIANLKDLQRFVGMDGEPPADEEAAKETIDTHDGPLLVWDARLADWFETKWELPDFAADMRTKARGRWEVFERQLPLDGKADAGKLWDGWYFSPNYLPDEKQEATDIASLIVRLLWRTEFRDQFEEAKARQQAFLPAITTHQLDLLDECAWQTGRVLVEGVGGELEIRNRKNIKVGLLIPGVATVDAHVLGRLQRELERTRGVDFLRVFSSLVAKGHEQYAQNPDCARPERIVLVGGWQALAELASIPRPMDAKHAFLLGRMLEIEFSSGVVLGLWKGETFRGGPGKPGRLIVDVADRLIPPRVHEGLLVPLLPPDREPGKPRDRELFAPSWLVAQYLLQHFRDYAIDLHRDGSVPLSEDEWLLLAKRAGASDRMDAIRGPLLSGDGKRPALVRVVASGRVDLTNDYADVRRFLVEGGKQTENRKAKGRAIQSKKKAALEQKTSKRDARKKRR